MALSEGRQVKGSITLHMPRVHAEKLAPAIAFLLQTTGLTAANLEAVAVSAGPGSYTGLRIGVSTAKGIAFAHDLPLVAVPTLEGLATQVQPFARPGDGIVVALDARRGDLYIAVFEVKVPSLEVPLERKMNETALPARNVVENLPQDTPLWLVGNGVDYLLREISEVPSTWRPVPWEVVHPSASALIPIAMRAIEQEAFVDLASFEPTYIRAFQTHPPRSRYQHPH